MERALAVPDSDDGYSDERPEENTMSYMAKNPAAYNGKVVGSPPLVGQCAVFVQVVSGAPRTGVWRRGRHARGDMTVLAGMAIATFDAVGRYTNSVDGTSHAAIYLRQDDAGILVWDQWVGQPVHQRWIRFQGGKPGVKPANDGDAFYVIE